MKSRSSHLQPVPLGQYWTFSGQSFFFFFHYHQQQTQHLESLSSLRKGLCLPLCETLPNGSENQVKCCLLGTIRQNSWLCLQCTTSCSCFLWHYEQHLLSKASELNLNPLSCEASLKFAGRTIPQWPPRAERIWLHPEKASGNSFATIIQRPHSTERPQNELYRSSPR